MENQEKTNEQPSTEEVKTEGAAGSAGSNQSLPNDLKHMADKAKSASQGFSFEKLFEGRVDRMNYMYGAIGGIVLGFILAMIPVIGFIISIALGVVGPLLQWVLHVDEFVNAIFYGPRTIGLSGIDMAATLSVATTLAAIAAITVARKSDGRWALVPYVALVLITATLAITRAIPAHPGTGFRSRRLGPAATALYPDRSRPSAAQGDEHGDD